LRAIGANFNHMTSAQDEERFNQLVQAYRPGLLIYCAKLTGGDRERAEDIVQETFIRAWRRIDQMHEGQGSVVGWLRRVAHNVAIDTHRMRQIRPPEVELEHPDVAVQAEETDAVLLRVLVERVLSSAWPEHRAVLTEVYLHDQTSTQAAERLGIPVGTVKSRIHYALRALRANAETVALMAS
jgi:RNA polymerase sigma-70 factor (ECF subfamily)